MAQIGTILSIAGFGMSAMGALGQGQTAAADARAQAAVMEYNARVQEQEARAIRAQAEYKAKRQAEEAARYASSLRAGMAASGVVTSEGTPLMIEAKQAAESELENLMIGYQGQVGANRALSQASLDRMQADIYKRKASSASRAGLMGAGTTLLTGFAKQWS
jgi:regulator of protease activity HflC (stomatin/prohibitin superfamily)